MELANEKITVYEPDPNVMELEKTCPGI